ncbi:MAG: hypothetical protein HN348_03500 [Proteobacteria bacterium]|jgi:hypothetical protein|nr:hypothetical protein [Pseudomonadota bacterium]
MHWSPEHMDALFEGTLGAETLTELVKHLAEPCEQCEQTLLDEGLDLETLARLIAAESAPEEHISPVERQAIWREVAPEARPRRHWWTAGAVVALAAAAIFLFFPGIISPPNGTNPENTYNVKGIDTEEPIAVELRIIAGEFTDEGFKSNRRIESGQSALSTETLLFELDAKKEGTRYLFAIDAAGELSLLAPPGGTLPDIEPAGRRQVSFDGQLVAFDLVDVASPLTLVSCASPIALDLQKEVIEPWQQHGKAGGISFVTMTIEVKP